MAQATVSVDQYQDLLRRSGLIEPPQLDQVLEALQQEHGGRVADSQILGKALVQAKIITPWQHETLMKGRCKGFFLGKYKLLRHIAKGGMSDVLLAVDTATKRTVALKVFPIQLIEKGSYLERFKREARTQYECDHPHIVKAYEFGQEGKVHYMTMEFVDGPDLARLVEQKGPLPFRQAAEFMRQASMALAYAHGRGMIHRDIKPANLMVNRAGRIKVLDLGLARVEGIEESLTLKHDENSLGTADYISPEQSIDSHSVDGRTDIYSLGGTFYFLLAGRPPFNEGSPVQRMMAHMNQPVQPISELREGVPQELADLIGRMLAKKADDRPPSMAAVHNTLALWLGSTLDLLEEPSSSSSSAMTSSIALRPQPAPAKPAGPARNHSANQANSSNKTATASPSAAPGPLAAPSKTAPQFTPQPVKPSPATAESITLSDDDTLPAINTGPASVSAAASSTVGRSAKPAQQGHSLLKIAGEIAYAAALGGLVAGVVCSTITPERIGLGLALGAGCALGRLALGLVLPARR